VIRKEIKRARNSNIPQALDKRKITGQWHKKKKN